MSVWTQEELNLGLPWSRAKADALAQMADEKPIQKKFTSGPFKGLLFSKRDVPDDATKIIIDLYGKRSIVVAKADYQTWSEAIV